VYGLPLRTVEGVGRSRYCWHSKSRSWSDP
jgi:hypothetical protein